MHNNQNMDPRLSLILSLQHKKFPYSKLPKPIRSQTPVNIEEVKQIIEDKLNIFNNMSSKSYKNQFKSEKSKNLVIDEKMPRSPSKSKRLSPAFSPIYNKRTSIFKEIRLRYPTPILKVKKSQILPRISKEKSFVQIRKFNSPIVFPGGLDVTEVPSAKIYLNSSSSSLSDDFPGARRYTHDFL